MNVSVYFLFWVVIQFHVTYFAVKIGIGSYVRLISVLFLKCPHLSLFICSPVCLCSLFHSGTTGYSRISVLPASAFEFTIYFCM